MRTPAALAAVLLATTAKAQDLSQLLKAGPVVSVTVNQKGRFQAATAVIEVARPPAAVWAIATDFAQYTKFMPKVEESKVVRKGPNQLQVTMELDVPGPDPEYTYRYDLHPATFTMSGRWIGGDLKDSYVEWRIEPLGKAGSLLYYTTSSLHFSSILQALEDSQQTITVGVNVAAALAVVKAIKRRAEAKP